MRLMPRATISIQLIALLVVTLTLLPAVSATGKYKVLYSFKGGTDGNFPSGGLLVDAAGNLYGTTVNGGSSGTCLYAQGTGCGMVFQLTPGPSGKWTESVLYRFQGGSDGGNPNGSLIFDAAGNLYGTTVQGGTGNSDGCGTVFQLAPGSGGWTESLVRTFCSNGANDGYFPKGGLAQNALGNLYGTTESGGANLGGVAFELIPISGGWTENVLHSFCLVGDCSTQGAQPVAGVTVDASGNLYGATITGGRTKFGCFSSFPPGCGLLFKLTPHLGGPWTESIPHLFTGPDGAGPGSRLTFDNRGNLYGTTSYDGAFGCGTVFKLAPNSHGQWTQTVLYNFRSSGSNQSAINSGVVLDAAGNLYGATDPDGTCCSVVYRLSPTKSGRWKYRVLHWFTGARDGGRTDGNIILDTQGNVYGTGGVGGAYGSGVVFEITP
jgi:uncharacterized repeat protein (TIGR03803 family)